MFYKETVEKGTMDLIDRLMKDDKFSSFNLVGGTALALKIGHRKSIDIDLFTTSDFNSPEISNHLSENYNVTRIQAINNGVFCLVDGIKVDLLAHKYPLIDDVEVIDGIRIISLVDISAMKLNAIYNNGTRLKDFVDVYTLLECFPLKDLLAASEQKYPQNHISMVRNALLHHEDIDFNVPVDFLGEKIKWSVIADRLREAVNNPQKVFVKIPPLTQKLMEKKPRNRQKPKGPRL